MSTPHRWPSARCWSGGPLPPCPVAPIGLPFAPPPPKVIASNLRQIVKWRQTNNADNLLGITLDNFEDFHKVRVRARRRHEQCRVVVVGGWVGADLRVPSHHTRSPTPPHPARASLNVLGLAPHSLRLRQLRPPRLRRAHACVRLRRRDDAPPRSPRGRHRRAAVAAGPDAGDDGVREAQGVHQERVPHLQASLHHGCRRPVPHPRPGPHPRPVALAFPTPPAPAAAAAQPPSSPPPRPLCMPTPFRIPFLCGRRALPCGRQPASPPRRLAASPPRRQP